ncbi:MAG: peptide chain release factor N(5)-glutamine methyltransferase [Bacteroidota bacterium]
MEKQENILVSDLRTRIQQSIKEVYETPESWAVTHRLLEFLAGETVLPHHYIAWDKIREEQLKNILERLQGGEPLQYITEEAPFFGHIYKVSPDVLIPRQETEELVQWVLDELPETGKLLDVGTGSGCIAISIALNQPETDVLAMDVSEAALSIGQYNAAALNAGVQFICQNALDETAWPAPLTALVSNPPYVPAIEKESLAARVRDYEPGLALFVPDNDPLLFYRVIATRGLSVLPPGGRLFFEIHESLGQEVVSLLENLGYENVELKQDLNGKDRMVRGLRKA